MRLIDENQTIADAQISISQEEEMDMIICDKSDVTYHPETKCMYPCTLSITCGLFWHYEPNNQTSVLNLCQLPRPLLGTPLTHKLQNCKNCKINVQTGKLIYPIATSLIAHKIIKKKRGTEPLPMVAKTACFAISTQI